jgi:hypothetical protein
MDKISIGYSYWIIPRLVQEKILLQFQTKQNSTENLRWLPGHFINSYLEIMALTEWILCTRQLLFLCKLYIRL